MTETHTPLPCPFCGGPAVAWVGHTLGDGYIIACSSANQCHVHPSVSDYDQAEALIAWNTRADSHHRLVDALEDARTALSITRTNVMAEIGRCSDESRSPWAGVPEQLAKRIAKIDAALKEAGRG